MPREILIAIFCFVYTLFLGNTIAQQYSGARNQNFREGHACEVACRHIIKYNLKMCVKCHYSLIESSKAQTVPKDNTVGFEAVYDALIELRGQRFRQGMLKKQSELPIPNTNVMGGTDYPLGQADWDPLAGQSVGGSEECNRHGQRWLSNCARRKTGLVGMGSVSYNISKDFVIV